MDFNLKTVFVFLFLIHANDCSYFDDAVMSVKEKFDNLFEDNGVTIDCTIFAVEQLVLSDNSYLDRCQQQMENNAQLALDSDSPSDVLTEDTAYEETQISDTSEVNNNDKSSLAAKVDISETTFSYPKKPDVLVKLDSIQASLQGETKHLMDIDTYLRQKLNKFSFDMNDNLNKSGTLENSSVLKDIKSNLGIIKKDENNKNSDPKVVDIENMVNEIIAISNSNNITETKIDTIIDTVANDINSSKDISHLESNIEPLKNEISIEHQLTTESPPEVVFDLGQKDIIRDKKEIVAENVSTDKIDDVLLDNSALSSINDLIQPQPIADNKEIDLLSDLFDNIGTESNNPTPLARTKEARNIMKEYRHSEAIINKYFNNPKYIIDVNPLTDLDNDDFFNDDLFTQVNGNDFN